MEKHLGLIGKKIGNTQIFTDNGEVRRVTVVETGPCVVVGKRTQEKHGYTALQLAFGTKRAKSVTKPEASQYKHAGIEAPQTVMEFRVPAELMAKYEVGQTIKTSDVFTEGGFVDVVGTSKGHGFTGVMVRHNFKGYKRTHGAHEYQRHGGSIGANMTPGRTIKGVGMPGQHGNSRVTVQNIRITKVMADENLVLLEGSVPGPRGAMITVRQAIKKKQAS